MDSFRQKLPLENAHKMTAATNRNMATVGSGHLNASQTGIIASNHPFEIDIEFPFSVFDEPDRNVHTTNQIPADSGMRFGKTSKANNTPTIAASIRNHRRT